MELGIIKRLVKAWRQDQGLQGLRHRGRGFTSPRNRRSYPCHALTRPDMSDMSDNLYMRLLSGVP